jgi:hypothetical protein
MSNTPELDANATGSGVTAANTGLLEYSSVEHTPSPRLYSPEQRALTGTNGTTYGIPSPAKGPVLARCFRFVGTSHVAGASAVSGAPLKRGGAAAARQPHKLEVAGSIPAPASNHRQERPDGSALARPARPNRGLMGGAVSGRRTRQVLLSGDKAPSGLSCRWNHRQESAPTGRHRESRARATNFCPTVYKQPGQPWGAVSCLWPSGLVATPRPVGAPSPAGVVS